MKDSFSLEGGFCLRNLLCTYWKEPQCLTGVLSGTLAWRHLELRQVSGLWSKCLLMGNRRCLSAAIYDILFQLQVLGRQRTNRDGVVVTQEYQPSALLPQMHLSTTNMFKTFLYSK